MIKYLDRSGLYSILPKKKFDIIFQWTSRHTEHDLKLCIDKDSNYNVESRFANLIQVSKRYSRAD